MVNEVIAFKPRRGSISLATAQTFEEFSICKKLHMGGKRLAAGITVEMKGVPDAVMSSYHSMLSA